MADDPPKLIALDHDDYKAKHVGHTADGRQFFLTNPFEWARDGRHGNEFVALFLFGIDGILLEAIIDEFGPRLTMDEQRWRDTYYRRLAELGQVSFGRIEVAPFSLERFGTVFGLIPSRDDETGDWWVELMPGNYIAFHAPWDSGEYDT